VFDEYPVNHHAPSRPHLRVHKLICLTEEPAIPSLSLALIMNTTRLAYCTTLYWENSSDVALGRLWARGAINADLCFQQSKATGNLTGTAFVARDLISVVDALDEDGMLRYWGKLTPQNRILV